MVYFYVFFLMIRRPPRSTLDRSSAASDVYKRQVYEQADIAAADGAAVIERADILVDQNGLVVAAQLSLIHISEPTRPY